MKWGCNREGRVLKVGINAGVKRDIEDVATGKMRDHDLYLFQTGDAKRIIKALEHAVSVVVAKTKQKKAAKEAEMVGAFGRGGHAKLNGSFRGKVGFWEY